MNLKLTDEHLCRRAIVYVRQSTPAQRLHNRESQRRQYGLADYARSLGFQEVETIDDDLGRTASGCVERPGFQRLVAEVCAGQIGGVFCIEASRLARNGKDWHHLIELCGLVNALVIDPEGMYDPRLINDRLLLGLKGTMSEFELNLFRQRPVEAIRQKAQRGELQFTLPVGLCWTAHGKIEIDPDLRVQQAIRTVLLKFQELGSARHVHMAFQTEGILAPALGADPTGLRINWRPPSYYNILSVVSNPMYAGAYAFGKTEVRTSVVGGQARKSDGHEKPRENWTVLIKDHHPGYITWEQFERNQSVLSENAYMKSRMGRKPGRGGRSLFAGLLRCGRCGRMMCIRYFGRDGNTPFFRCRARTYYGLKGCASFNGWRADQAVSSELLQALEGHAVEAAQRVEQQDTAGHEALALELQQAEYEARLAQRRYEAVDPDNRLVASGLETEWENRLRDLAAAEMELRRREQQRPNSLSLAQLQTLQRLGSDIGQVWTATTTTNRDRKERVRSLLEEVIFHLKRAEGRAHLTLRWRGGAITTLNVPVPKFKPMGPRTDEDTLSLLRRLAALYPDEVIAGILNRQGRKTAMGERFTANQAGSLRRYRDIPRYQPPFTAPDGELVSIRKAAQILSMNTSSIHRWLADGFIAGEQATPGAPWQIRITDELRARIVQQAPAEYLPMLETTMKLGVSRQTVLQRVKRGELEAVLVRQGRRKGLRIKVVDQQPQLFQ